MERSEDWLRQGVRDLEKSKLDLEHAYYDWACFTAHQAAEKAVKAVYQARNEEVRGHALLRLLQGLESAEVPEALLHHARVLDRYYIELGNPNNFPAGAPQDYFDLELAEDAIDAAQAIVGLCRDQLTSLAA